VLTLSCLSRISSVRRTLARPWLTPRDDGTDTASRAKGFRSTLSGVRSDLPRAACHRERSERKGSTETSW
jgi:hypothetical protein